MKLAKCPNEQLALSNCIILNKFNAPSNTNYAKLNGKIFKMIIKSATSFAFNGHLKVGTLATIDETSTENMQISHQDFVNDFSQVQAAFGANDEGLSARVKFGIIHVSPQIDWVFNDGHLSVSSVRTNIDGLLLHGPTGSVKTSIAVDIAKISDFPFVKMISPETILAC
jgi:vesicle-fusing ATPase